MNNKNVTVKFLSDGTKVVTSLGSIERGKVKNPNAKDVKALQLEGKIFDTNKFGQVKVLKYTNANDLLIEFISDGTQVRVTAGNLRKGKASNPNAKSSSVYDGIISKIFETNNFGRFKVINRRDDGKFLVRFLDTSTKVYATGQRIINGAVKDPCLPNVCGVGFIGQGSFSAKTNPEDYNKWNALLGRCYSPKVQKKQPSYIGCTVNERWHNFQNYCKDVQSMIGYDQEDWALDKDVLFKNNKIYGPDTCCFLPYNLNSMLVKRKAERGEYMIGVHCNRNLKHKYVAQCGDLDGVKDRIIGYFDTELEAFEAYKEYKEKLVRKRVRSYKEQIDKRAYKALINYTVDIDD